MHPSIERACEEIDAAFFSGDGFHNEVSLAKISFYVGRWRREINSIEECLEEEKEKP